MYVWQIWETSVDKRGCVYATFFVCVDVACILYILYILYINGWCFVWVGVLLKNEEGSFYEGHDGMSKSMDREAE